MQLLKVSKLSPHRFCASAARRAVPTSTQNAVRSQKVTQSPSSCGCSTGGSRLLPAAASSAACSSFFGGTALASANTRRICSRSSAEQVHWTSSAGQPNRSRRTVSARFAAVSSKRSSAPSSAENARSISHRLSNCSAVTRRTSLIFICAAVRSVARMYWLVKASHRLVALMQRLESPAGRVLGVSVSPHESVRRAASNSPSVSLRARPQHSSCRPQSAQTAS